MAQNSISQEAYIIWLWFLVHMCKVMTSQNVFFSVLKFSFSWLLGWFKGKKWPKMTKNSVCLTPYLRNCTSYDCGFWYTSVKWWYLQLSFIFFQNSDFLEGKRAKNDPWLPISVCRTLYLKNCRSYHEDYWYTGIEYWYLQVLFFLYFFYFFIFFLFL